MLCRYDYDGRPDSYCCLGVLSKVCDTKRVNGKRLSTHIQNKVGLSTDSMEKLIVLNDFEGRNFFQIADWIEKNL